MFTATAQFYDAVYSFKDYPKEAEAVHEAIEAHRESPGTLLLDVACGTGKHMAELARWYQVEGVDLDPTLLTIASERIPQGLLHIGDMRTFDLGRQFDVVTCLFSSVAYMDNLADLRLAIANMVKHLLPGGVFVMEPFLYPDAFDAGFLHFLAVNEPDLKIARMNQSKVVNGVAVLDFEYLIASVDGISRFSEHHVLGLFTQDEYSKALSDVGLNVEYDPIGPTGRGLFIGMKTPPP